MLNFLLVSFFFLNDTINTKLVNENRKKNWATECIPKIATEDLEKLMDQGIYTVYKPWDLCLAKAPQRVNGIQHAGLFIGISIGNV